MSLHLLPTERKRERKIERETEKDREIERDLFFIFLKVHLGDNPSLAVKILNDTPRPNVPSQKAWLEIASDNHSRIFTNRERERERHSKRFIKRNM